MDDASTDRSTPIPLIDALRDRRSGRAFEDRHPSDAVVASILDAARWAASGGNGQPWRYVVARRGTDAFDALAATLNPGNATWASTAPLLVLATVQTVRYREGKPPAVNGNARLDLGLSIAQMLVQATALGVMGHVMAGFDAEAAARVVDLPDDHEAPVVVALGYPADPSTLPDDLRARETAPRTRVDASETCFEGRFGRPLPLWERRGSDPA